MDAQYWLRECYLRSAKSHDPRTQNAAMLVSNVEGAYVAGINQLPPGMEPIGFRVIPPWKYKYMIHAEAMALVIAGKEMASQSTLYCPWAACMACAGLIIAAGVKHVVVHAECVKRTPEHWHDETTTAWEMLHEAGVVYEQWSGKVGGCRHLFDGTYWEP